MKYFLVILSWIALSFSSLAQCDQPTYLQANNITASSADLSWTPNAGELYWKLEWGPDGFVLGEGTIVDSLESPSYFLTDLEAETSYDYYVWAICEDVISTQSALEFMTLPLNNMTCDAITITVNDDSSTFVNNTNAIPYGPDPPCWANQIAGDLWFKFELTEASGIEITSSPGTSDDSHIALYQVSGCDDDSLIYDLLYCSEDISATDWMSYIITEELSPGEYYIQCGTWFNAAGSYTIRVDTAEAIVLPSNDQCSGAPVSVLEVNGPAVELSGNGSNATDENFMGETHVWEAFSIDTCADVTLNFCGSSPIPLAIYSILYADCPSSSPFMSGNYLSNVCEDDNDGIYFQHLAPGTYYYPVIADPNVGGYEAYQMSISAVTCTSAPQPDTCTTWVNGPYGDFNYYFGGAPTPNEEGNCPIYTMDEFAIYASEYYDIDNFIAGTEYTLGVCSGEGAGTWPVEIAVLDSNLSIIAWADSCQISFIAPYSGTFYFAFNEIGACGTANAVDNGYISLTCGDVILGISDIKQALFSVYPNPSKGLFKVENIAENAYLELIVMDASGKALWTKEQYLNKGASLEIDLPNVSSGLYFLKVINLDDRSYSIKRLIVE